MGYTKKPAFNRVKQNKPAFNRVIQKKPAFNRVKQNKPAFNRVKQNKLRFVKKKGDNSWTNWKYYKKHYTFLNLLYIFWEGHHESSSTERPHLRLWIIKIDLHKNSTLSLKNKTMRKSQKSLYLFIYMTWNLEYFGCFHNI